MSAEPAPTPHRRGSVRAVLAHRDFRLLWAGQSLSTIGDEMIVVILALYVVDATGSGRDLGIVLAAQTLALVALILIGGVWADRLPRQRIMIGADLLRCAVQVTIAALVVVDALPIWALALLVACFGVGEAFFRPAYAGLIPQTVPEAAIQEAQALTHMSNTVARFVGPALGTALALTVGFAAAWLIDAATFLVSAALLLAVRGRARGAAAPAAERRSLWAELAEGFREVRVRPWVWTVLASAAVVLFVAFAPFLALGALVAKEEYGSASVYGWLAAASGAGAVAGAVIGLRWRPRRPIATGCLLFAAWPAEVLLFALGAPLWVVIPGTISGGVAFTLFIVWWETALAERIPPHALSRVTSYDWMVSLSLLPAGLLAAGLLSESVAPGTLLAAGAAVGVAVTLAPLLSADTRRLGTADR